ncbi:Ldh family oxidoreductase [Chloroflexi bacterium TSY]|nr:Ldh family oxidoreductase [Chloroflexi bacterium TSY]
MMKPSKAEHRVDSTKLLQVVQNAFECCGMTADDAHLLADTLVYADLSGIHSHGVLRVPEYIKKLTVDGVNVRGRPHVVREFGACLVVDGANSMGQIGMNFAMQQVLERANLHGIAAAGIRGSNHSGAMAYFAAQALEHDMIGIATTNALPTMAPWGGAEKIWVSTRSALPSPRETNCLSSMMRPLAGHPTARSVSTSRKGYLCLKAGRLTAKADRPPIPPPPSMAFWLPLVVSKALGWR